VREWDGHMALADGYGGAATTPSENPIRSITQPTSGNQFDRPATSSDDQNKSGCTVNVFGHEFQAPCLQLPRLNTSDSGDGRQAGDTAKTCGGLAIGPLVLGASACSSAPAIARPQPKLVDPKVAVLGLVAAACALVCPSLANQANKDFQRERKHIGDEAQKRAEAINPQQLQLDTPPENDPTRGGGPGPKWLAKLLLAILILGGGEEAVGPLHAREPTPTPTPTPTPMPCNVTAPAACPSPAPTPTGPFEAPYP